MRNFTAETAIAAVELEQMVVDYFDTLDTKGGGSALHFFTEDCDVDLGAIKYTGHAGMKQFYGNLHERVGSAPRTVRHGFINFKVCSLNR